MRAASTRKLLAIFVALCSTACSDTGSKTTPQRSEASVRTGSIAIAFKDASPAAAATAHLLRSKRSRQFLSPGTVTLTITIDGETSGSNSTTTLTPQNCSSDASGNALVCPAQTVIAPAGTDAVYVTAYDAKPSMLGSGRIIANVIAGQTSPVAIALDGQIATVVLALSDNVPAIGAPSTVSLTSVSTDDQGYTIIGDYVNPLDVTSNDSSMETTLSKTSLNGSADAIAVTYAGTSSTAVTFTGTTRLAGSAQNVGLSGSVTLEPGAGYGNEIAVPGGGGTSNCSVYVFNPTGTATANASSPTESVGCSVVAVAPNGDIVTDASLNGPGLFLFAGFLTQDRPLAELRDGYGQIHFDAAGNLYVNHTTSIDVYAPPIFSSQYPTYTIVPPASAQGATLITDASQNLWLIGTSAITEIANVAGPSQVLRSIDEGPEKVLSASFGPSNELWFCENGQLERIAPSATSLTSPTAEITLPTDQFCATIHVDRAGSVYVLANYDAGQTAKLQYIDVYPSGANGAAAPTSSFSLPQSQIGSEDFGLQNGI